MKEHKNPYLSSYDKDLEVGETMNLSERNFRMAFAVEPYFSPKFLMNDPAYVIWLFHLWGKKEGVSYSTILPHHICNEEDYAEFFPISPKSAILMKEIQDDPNRDFYCIDWNADESIEVYGNENEANYQRLEVILMPCNNLKTDIA